MAISIQEFAAKVKAKYPEYQSVNDATLTQKIIEKYPEYEGQVDMSLGAEPEQQFGIMPEPVSEDLGVMGDVGQALFPSSAAIAQQPFVEKDVQLVEPYETGLPTLTKTDEGLAYDEQGTRLIEDIPTIEAVGMTPDERSFQQGGGIVQDVSSFTERAMGAFLTPEEGKTFMQELSNPESSITKKYKKQLESTNLPPLIKFAGDALLSMVSDPTIVGGLARMGLKAPSKAISKSLKGKIKKTLGVERVARLKKLPGKLRPSELVATGGEELTSIPRGVLRKWGTPSGRKELRAAYGTQDDVGQEIIDFVNAFDERFPEHLKVRKMLENMKPIQLKDVIKTLEGSKVKNPTPVNVGLNDKIDNLIGTIEQRVKLPDTKFSWEGVTIQEGKTLKGGTRKVDTWRGDRNELGQPINEEGDVISGGVIGTKPMKIPSQKIPEIKTKGGKRIAKGETIKKTELSATEFRDLRKQLDDEVKGAFDKDFRSGYEKALLSGRKTMMENLKQAARKSGVPEYENLMELYAKKVSAVERVKKNLGQKIQGQTEAAETYVANIGNFGKSQKLKNLQDLDDLMGSDFVKRAKSAQEARQLGRGEADELEVPWTPKFQTGAKLRAVLTAGIGSPKIVSRIFIPLLDGMEKSVQKMGSTAMKSLYKARDKGFVYLPLLKILNSMTATEKKRLESLAKAYDKKPSKKLADAIKKITKLK